jgi:glycosyltransferase involved in cell wall biosynthesis
MLNWPESAIPWSFRVRVAIIHDWLYVFGGAERVLAELLKCYPDADVFTLFDVLSDRDRQALGLKQTVHTSFLQRMPFIRNHHRKYLPLMPIAIEQFDLTGYDLVISSSHAVARGVITGPDQVHVSYVHSPMRYAWDLQHTSLRQWGLDQGLKSLLARWTLHKMRMWDVRTSHGADAIACNSKFVARRIRKIYGRTATVIHPPVEVPAAPTIRPRGDYFFAASRLVPYKNIGLIVEAFNRMPHVKLIVAGDGPDAKRLKAIAGPNVTFKGWVTDSEMRELMASARAFVFAAEEDFGIAPVEAQAEGTPVLAYGRGGALETIRGDGPDRTGLFFHDQKPEAIIDCVHDFMEIEGSFSRANCRKQAEAFSSEVFRKKFMAFVDASLHHSDSYPMHKDKPSARG